MDIEAALRDRVRRIEAERDALRAELANERGKAWEAWVSLERETEARWDAWVERKASDAAGHVLDKRCKELRDERDALRAENERLKEESEVLQAANDGEPWAGLVLGRQRDEAVAENARLRRVVEAARSAADACTPKCRVCRKPATMSARNAVREQFCDDCWPEAKARRGVRGEQYYDNHAPVQPCSEVRGLIDELAALDAAEVSR